jgi:hypothetical protein
MIPWQLTTPYPVHMKVVRKRVYLLKNHPFNLAPVFHAFDQCDYSPCNSTHLSEEWRVDSFCQKLVRLAVQWSVVSGSRFRSRASS